MKRKLLALAVAAGLLLSACASDPAPTGSAAAPSGDATSATAVDWPAQGKMIQLYVGYAAGGVSDASARLFASELEKETGARVQVINQEGAGTVLSHQTMLTQPTDGYSMSFVAMPALLMSVYSGEPAPFQISDFSLIGAAAMSVNALIVRADSPYQSIDDLVADAKTKKLNVGDNGSAEDAIVLGGIEDQGGVEFQRVVYNGTPEKVQGLLSGDVVAFSGATGGATGAQIADGKFRVLASWVAERTALTQSIPTATEQGYPIAYDSLHAYAFAAGVPAEIRQAAEDVLKKICAKQEYIDQQATSQIESYFRTGEELAGIWGNVETMLKEAGEKYNK